MKYSIPKRIENFLLGKPLDPRPGRRDVQKHTLLVAFLAWIGLGADGLSSACYGPEAAFLALGQHTHLSLYLALAVTLTVFIIALGYNQIIELFPTGGGGYKCSTQLIGPHAGLISGAALIVDYILTISISIASGTDALFSLFPAKDQTYKHFFEIFSLFLLLIINLRGAKESIKLLMPIFLIFFISHLVLIGYGIFSHIHRIPLLISDTIQETLELGHTMGWVFVVALLLRAYTMGAGTYTGIEAVSNNVNQLAEPRIRTGQWTMGYMALSLSVMASGIMIVYLIWEIQPVSGQTLNAITFQTILQDWTWAGIELGPPALVIVMLSETLLLFVAANTGYLGGPAVLANMAVDSWVPIHFRHLSSRLVMQNGVFLMGVASLCILLWTKGEVKLLLIMYSINVFMTFALSLLGLSIHWYRSKASLRKKIIRLSLSITGFLITSSILIVTIFEKFTEGGWITLLITGCLITFCLIIKRHYETVKRAITKLDRAFDKPIHRDSPLIPCEIKRKQHTAVFFIGEHVGLGLHIVQKVLTLLPNQYENFVFIGIAEVDAQNVMEETAIQHAGHTVEQKLRRCVQFCRSHTLSATYYFSYDADVIEGLTDLSEKINHRYPNCVFFTGTMIFERINWLYHCLHNRTEILVQQHLNSKGLCMMLLPVRLQIP